MIAYPLGSMPEIIRPGRTGFLVDDVDGAVAGVHAITTLDRASCRRDAQTRFSHERMVTEYEDLFRRVVDGLVPGAGRPGTTNPTAAPT